jgi:putative hydrolase of the HAD superfamily
MIFFDIDETLLNNNAAERNAAQGFYYLHRNNIQASLDDFLERWKILTENNVQRYLAGKLSFQGQRRERLRQLFVNKRSLSDDEADAMFASYLNIYESSWELFPDVKSCLNKLTGYELGIISNGSAIQQRQKLESLGILDRFSTIVISGDVGVSKPDSRIFLIACRQAGVSLSECLHVGDDLKADVLGSISAGLNGIWINRYGQTHQSGIPSIRSLKGLKGYIDHNIRRQSQDDV